MEELTNNLQQLLAATWSVLASLSVVLLPWTPLVAWVVFWTFGVNWSKLREVILQGGWIAILLVYLVMILIWGLIAPPPDGAHYLLGLTVSNFVGKTVYVTGLFAIMLLCGSVQLSGCCAGCCNFEENADQAEAQVEGH